MGAGTGWGTSRGLANILPPLVTVAHCPFFPYPPLSSLPLPPRALCTMGRPSWVRLLHLAGQPAAPTAHVGFAHLHRVSTAARREGHLPRQEGGSQKRLMLGLPQFTPG